MIPNQLGLPVRSILAAAVICAILSPPMRARAEEPSPRGSHGEVPSTAKLPAASDAAVPPTTSISWAWIGSTQDSASVVIRFSQAVTGFFVEEINITCTHSTTACAQADPLNTDAGRTFGVTLRMPQDYDGLVIIHVPQGVAQNTSQEGNIASRVLTIDVDTRGPEVSDAKVDGDEVAIVFDEDLNQNFVPSPNNFQVSFRRPGVSHRVKTISRVEVTRREVLLILASPVDTLDAVRVFYDDRGANALRDLIGNHAFGFDRAVRNVTGQARVGVPGVPRNLTATAVGSTTIELEWDAPTSDGGREITGYLIEWSEDGGVTWSSLVRNTRNTDTVYRHTGLPAGVTHHYRVSAINFNGTGDPSNVASDTTEDLKPSEPRRLSARARGTSAIELSWTIPSTVGGGGITGYRIEVSRTGTGGWLVLEADTESTATAYTHTDLSAGSTRYYRVAAINRAGRGPWSSVESATTVRTAPSAPTGLRAVAGGPRGSTELRLTWTTPVTDGGRPITGYRIQMSPNGASGWVDVVANTGSTTTTYLHTNLAPGTTRYYRVAAINAEGRSAYSNVATGTTTTARPGQPRSLRAQADGPTRITLSWEAPSSDGGARITGYRIEVRGPGGATWLPVSANTRSTATTFTHTGLQPASAYRYRVAAINSQGAGQWSLEVVVTTHAAPPDAPTSLVARATGSSRISLSWAAPRNTGGARIIGYKIDVSTNSGTSWQPLRNNTGSSATTFAHTGLPPGTRRDYRVSAINTAGIGPPSRVAWARTEAVLPGAPRSVMARSAGSTAIELSWMAPTSTGGATITSYRIEASTDRSDWTIVGTHTQGATTFRHAGLLPGTTWHYRVSAINSKGAGPSSAVATATTDATVPGLPRSLSAAAVGPNAIYLDWDAPSTDGGAPITGYRIEVATTAAGPWGPLVANSRSTATTYRHTGLPPVTTRYYRVSAINSAGVGQAVGPASATTLADVPAAPTNLTATPRGTSQITLSWTTPTNNGGARITGYRIEVSEDEGSTWTDLRPNTGAVTTMFLHTNLRPASTRHYRVSAINRAGVGEASNVARATTEATFPGVPRELTAEANGTSQIDLSWEEPASDGGARITGYRIEVSEDRGANWQDLLANTRTPRTTYAHTGLEPGTTRSYRVSAINRIGVGRASRIANATTDATVPDAPTGLVATAASPTRIDLTWVAPAYDGGAAITGYRIEVSETGAAWTDLVPHSGNAGTLFSHVGLRPGSARHYRVSAINRAGVGAPSGVASAETDDPVQRAARLNARVLPHVAAAMTSSTVSAIAGRVDAVARGMGMERRVETSGLSSMAASLAAPGTGGIGLAQRDRASLAALFGGTSFTMPVGAAGAPQQSATGTKLASWGAGEYHYLGEPGASALDWKGNMVSAHVGVDARIGPDILAGVAASYSSGSFDFNDKTGASAVAGTYGATMASVHPYVAWFSGEPGNSVWGSAGFGRGDIEVDDEREGLRTSPASVLTGAGGASYQLYSTGGRGIRVKAEGWAGRVMVDGGAQIQEVTLNMQRGKLALELTQGFRADAGQEMAFVLEGGMRYDNGDGVNGASGEVGGGFRYTNSNVGLTAEGRGRFVLSARDGYEEWGLGGMFQFDPAARGQGLSIRVAPAYGDHRSGVNQLWERGVYDAMGGSDLGMGANVDGEVAYGIAGFHGTPYSGFYLGESGVRAFSSGVRYDLGAGVGLRLEGTRRESGPEGARHSVGIRGRIRLR